MLYRCSYNLHMDEVAYLHIHRDDRRTLWLKLDDCIDILMLLRLEKCIVFQKLKLVAGKRRTSYWKSAKFRTSLYIHTDIIEQLIDRLDICAHRRAINILEALQRRLCSIRLDDAYNRPELFEAFNINWDFDGDTLW